MSFVIGHLLFVIHPISPSPHLPISPSPHLPIAPQPHKVGTASPPSPHHPDP
ncbi:MULTISPECIES: hypothetical protein [Fischerella]|uniref:hypothetical protein n=1 Tax=Fischerella TaxID=1190 RepID=UPI00031609F2|nr:MULTISPECIES: hypothetical protein [Fischerella]MBD2430576.1 hypothetical protein [Fischerella sp. FACHB-380]